MIITTRTYFKAIIANQRKLNALWEQVLLRAAN